MMRVLLHGNTVAHSVGLEGFRHSMSLFTGGVMLFYIVIAVGACLWEVRLAKEEEYWKGLILPFAALLIGTRILGIILLIIFGVVQYRKKKKRELEEMKIKDL